MPLEQILKYKMAQLFEKRKQRIINYNHSLNINEYCLFNYINEYAKQFIMWIDMSELMT